MLTLGRFRLLRAPRFFRTAAKAEGRVLTAPGLIWATGIARPPFVASLGGKNPLEERALTDQ